MPDRRRHRGAHPDDGRLFADEKVPALQQAVRDLSWLLSHGYAAPSAVKLVGDRYQLAERQRTAVLRCSCSDFSQQKRARTRKATDQLRDVALAIDGFNLLTTIEVALSSGILIRGRDGCLRDMASMHGTYRRVEETIPALTLIGEQLQETGVARAVWLLDRPVSNSGRLAGVIGDLATDEGWEWTTQLHNDPDTRLIDMTDHVVVSADSFVIENASRWADLASAIVAGMPETRIIDLGGER